MPRFEKLHRMDEAVTRPLVTALEKCSRPAVVCVVSGTVGLTWLVLLCVVKIRIMRMGALTSDIAYYENMLYNTGYSFSKRSFDFLYTWYDLLTHGSPTYLTEHFSPTLALLAPGYWLFPNPLYLTVMQPLLSTLAGWGLYRLSRRVLERNNAPPMLGLLPVFFQAAYLFNYSNISAITDTLYGFHQDSMIAPLLVWTLVCVFEERWRIALMLFVLFLGVKENLPIITAPGLGLCFIFNRIVPRKKAALGLLLCAGFFACCYYFEFRTHNRHVSIIHRFFDLDYVMDAMIRRVKWTIIYPLWPALLTPFFALPALTDWALQLVGDTMELDWHSYPVLMFTQIAFAYTCITAFSLTKRWRVLSLAGYAALVGLVTAPMVAQGCKAYVAIHRGAFSLPLLVDVEAAKALAATVPKQARLSVTSELEIFLAERRRLLWPESGPYAEYVLINRRKEEVNKAQAAEFMRGYPDGDPAGVHFYGDLHILLSGYGYDTALMGYIDKLVASGDATLLKTQGKLELYRIHAPLSFSLH